MFRLRVFFRSSSNAIKSAMLEPVGTSSSSSGGSSCITSLRAQSTQVQHNKPPLQTSAQSASLPAQSSPNSPSFHYTLDPSSLPKLRPNQRQLTTEQRAFYEENGYIIIPKLVSDADLERYARRFKDYATGVLRTPPGMVVQKEVTKKGEPLTEKTLYKLQELYTDDVLFGYCRDPNILDYVSNFVGPDVLAIHSMFINKPPIDSSSSRHPLHQEIHYFPIRPVEKIVCSWMPLEATNRENGCLVVVPGSHKMEHLEHDYPDWEGGVNKFYYGIKDAKLAEKRIHVEMEPGDALFFSPLVIHGSGMNRSSGFRKAFSCHFASAHCDFISVNGTIQEKLANEILGTYVNKLNNETVDEKLKATKIDYPTMWRLRSRLVRGSGPFKRA